MSVAAIPPPPREIRPTHPAPILKAIARAFLVIVIAATVLLWVGLLHEGVMRWLGHEVSAQLISIHERKSSGGSYSHLARYRYEIPGHAPRSDESSISWNAWHRLSKPYLTREGIPNDITLPTTAPAAPAGPVGELGLPGPATIPVRAYALGPLTYSRAAEHEWAFLFLLIPALFAPLMALLSWVLHLAIIVRPRRQRWLYSHGSAVTGLITGQSTIRGRHGELYFADYSYAPANESALRHGRAMLAGHKEYETAVPGKAVLVLYDPNKPKFSAVYEYGGYAWQ